MLQQQQNDNRNINLMKCWIFLSMYINSKNVKSIIFVAIWVHSVWNLKFMTTNDIYIQHNELTIYLEITSLFMSISHGSFNSMLIYIIGSNTTFCIMF